MDKTLNHFIALTVFLIGLNTNLVSANGDSVARKDICFGEGCSTYRSSARAPTSGADPEITSIQETEIKIEFDPSQIELPTYNFNNEVDYGEKWGLERDLLTTTSPKGTPTTAADNEYFTSDEYSRWLSALRQCEPRAQKAEECCGRPERCLTDTDGKVGEGNAAAGQMIQMLMGAAVQLPASITSMCDRAGTAAQAATAMNTYLAAKCADKARQCNSACKSTRDQVRRVYDRMRRTDDGYEEISELYDKYYAAMERCSGTANQSAMLANQAYTSQLSKQFSDLCKKQASSDTDVETDQFANPNCNTPGAANTAICQSYCGRAGASADPNCQGYFASLNQQPGFSTPNLPEAEANPFANIGLDDEGSQETQFQDVNAVANKSTGGSGGGGGAGLGGGASGGSGADGGAQGGAHGGEGYDTKIDRGLASGNGYVGPMLRTGSGGGFSGYGQGGAITDKTKGKPFNLKDFLPGGAKNKVAFRGLASSLPDVAPAHADIFQKVSDRFYALCLRDALYDCENLRKQKRTTTNRAGP